MEAVLVSYEVVAVIGIVAGLGTTVAARTGAGRHVGAQLAALRSPIGLANVAWAVLGVAVGAWYVAAFALAVGVIQLRRSLPLRWSAGDAAPLRRPSSGDDGLRLVTANVLVDNRRFAELTRRLLQDPPDVLLLQEVVPRHADVLAELVRRRPDLHLVMEPRDDYAGWAIVSRFPVLDRGRMDVPGWPVSWAVVDHPVTPIRVVNVHAAAPRTRADVDTWQEQFELLGGLADGVLPTVLAGDFNATDDHRAFRRLLAAGFADAFEHAGRGWGATWPVSRFLPPLLRLDHILVDDRLTVVRVGTVDLPGSDHRGVVARLGPTCDAGSAAPVAPTESSRSGP